MKTNFGVLLALLLVLMPISGCQPEPEKKGDTAVQNENQVYQVSTINALMQGVYEGESTFGELQDKGNLGIGTFEALDGEMIMIDGVFYQVKSDGKVLVAAADQKTPFADITHYWADDVANIKSIDSMASLQKTIDPYLKNPNIFYAIRVDGTFDYIKARSVPAQSQPYPPLDQAIKQQQVFEYKNVEGTILGFWCPAYVNGINMPGYHFHFISKDRQQGGHLLECQVREALLGIDRTEDFAMHLPDSEAFSQSNLGQDQSKALNKVER